MDIVPYIDKMEKYLKADDVIDYGNKEIAHVADTLFQEANNELEFIKKAYELVRDHISHSADINEDILTCTASQVLSAGHGICFAKSHLLAAILRCKSVPAGFCYQKLILDDETAPVLIYHGLNGVYIKEYQKWIRLDARGNKKGVNAQFSIEKEQLAFPVRTEKGEEDDFVVYPAPDRKVLDKFRRNKTRTELWDDLPTELAYKLCISSLNENKIQEQFNLIANEYDANRKRFIPCFDDYYITSTKMILANIETPHRVLDLGAGTGLLSYYWYRQCDTAKYVLVDIAEDMLEVSKKRFCGIENISHESLDYTKQLPEGEFDVVISALSIHHLSDIQKKELFREIYDKLPAGGLFANYDQFCADTSEMSKWMDSYWELQLYNSGLTNRDIELWKERRKLDKECSVETEMAVLRDCHFTDVQCVYSYHKFSVIVAKK